MAEEIEVNWEAIGVIAEFLGGGAVVVSLIYLAIQARQSAQFERSENYGRIVETIARLLSSVSENPTVAHLMVVGSTDMDELETEERVRFGFLMYEIFGNYEFIYEQSKENALPAHVWPHYRQHVEFWASLPGVRQWWTARKAVFSDGFMEAASPFFEKPGLSQQEAKDMWRKW